MYQLLLNGQYGVFTLILMAIVLSLSAHEFGHAWVAKLNGDNTAKNMGRMTLNPIAHIDPIGLLMVVLISFGFAKPVPTNPNNFRSRWSSFYVAAAGPAMNLLIAIVLINLFMFGKMQQWAFLNNPGVEMFVFYLTSINMILALFNLIPLGPLDGHYLMPYLLPRHLAARYIILNAQYGGLVLVGLIILNMMGYPIFSNLLSLGEYLLSWFIVV